MRSSEKSRVAAAVTPVLLLGATAGFGWYYQRFYPVGQWLFWRYAGYWLACLGFSLACVSSGYALVVRLRRSPLPFGESLCLSFAAGLGLFYLATNLLGHLHALRWPAFFLLPAVMVAAGARPLWRTSRRWLGHVRHRRRCYPRPSDPWVTLAHLFGLAVVAMIYFEILWPENAQFDARWKHLALAEQYAHLGYIPRYGEGWTVATNPHLASMVFGWAFLLPKARLFDHVALSAHLELTITLWGVAAIVPLVRRLVPGCRAEAAWAARFLFPGVLLYDSSLACGADHIAAAFAAPIFLALLRALPSLAPGRCALLALIMGGGAMPKLTSAILLLPVPALAVVGTALWRAVRPGERRAFQCAHGPPRLWLGPLVAALVGLAATSPFWLRNLVWHGDPLYPSLFRHLGPRPWTEDAADLFAYGYKEYQFWRPTHDWAGVKQTLGALFSFSFVPNDYGRYHGKMPTFGSLFTLLLLCLPLLRGTKRLWGLTGTTYAAIFTWYWVHHQDRYLQTIVPWMAAVVAATVVLLWRTGVAARAGVALLIGAQVVIGADVYFIESHAMIRTPIKKSLDLLSAGYRRRYEQRFKVFSSWVDVGKLLPPDANVLTHDTHVHLGLGRRTTNDWGGWQFGISYGQLLTPRRVYDKLRELGVSHVAWRSEISKGWDSVAGDLVFFDFAMNHLQGVRSTGAMRVAKLPGKPPPDEAGEVALFGCNDMYRDGLYPLPALTVPVFGPKSRRFPKPAVAAQPGEADAVLQKAAFAVIDPACAREAQAKLAGRFVLAARRTLVNAKRSKRKHDWLLYLRRR